MINSTEGLIIISVIITLVVIYLIFAAMGTSNNKIIVEANHKEDAGQGMRIKSANTNSGAVNSDMRKTNSKIKIRSTNSLKDKEIDFLKLQEIINEQTSIELDIHDLWTDTILDKLFLTIPFVHTLSEFIHQHETSAEQAVEIGGFLLGRFALNQSSNRYQVILESFVPIKPESNSLFHIEFSTRSIMMDLGDAQDKFPNLFVVGWMHTHPGHGLFLSKQDLTIQEGFFNKHWQLAMEIDSLTPELDLAIFTHKLDGKINNTSTPKNWFSWRQLSNSTY